MEPTLLAAFASLLALGFGAGWLWARRRRADLQALEVRLAQLHRALSLDEKPRSGTTAGGQLEDLAAQLTVWQRQVTMLTAALDGMVEGIWITDAQGTVIRHNDALKGLLYAGQSLIGRRPAEVVRSAELTDAVRAACEKSESARLELTIDGVRPRALAVMVAGLPQKLGGSLAVFHDLTELRRLEKVRTDFVANVSHELRTPITAIRGYAETLRAGALADERNAPAMVEIIHRQSERLSELVEDLLELSRIEGRELELKSEPVSLHLAATRAAEAVRPKAESKQVRVELAVPGELWAQGDPRAVEQILLNLLDNAIKYTPGGGQVRVQASPSAAGAAVEVVDSGMGLEPRHLPRVFERFYRVDQGRSRDMGGTGLGLSIVKHLATSMGGDVQVVSQPGAGSTFTVSLPASRQPPMPG